ncbi:DUF2975 domain-containing protein [Labrenzia sp. 011]|uniref:DUF2975 domain-containing protein n=1 Tax=Labrenzia sp. 011 TaxID=2171494 RepID=UPI00105708A7|nr:DUF2975 domain-containing protein [Labrenzia sp. 011]
MSNQAQAERETRLTRIRQLSNMMKWFVTVLLILVAVISAGLVSALLLPAILDVSTAIFEIAPVERKLSEVPFGQRLGLIALVFSAFFLLSRLFWNIRQLFVQFHNGAFFTSSTQTRILNAGLWLLAFGFFDILSKPVASVLLTWDHALGDRSLVVELTGSELFFLVFGSLMLVFGWIMREAASLADENRQFV